MNKYEQLIEYIINEQEDKARELFHSIVVEKSREIYESLIDETDLAEVGGDNVESMVDEITADEEGLQEEGEDDMGDMDDMDDEGSDEGDMDAEVELGGEEDGLEDRVMDLEDDLEALKAEFDRIIGGGEEAADDMGGDDMMDTEVEFGDDEGSEEEMEGYGMGMMEAKDDMKADKKADKKAEKKEPRKMTEAEWLREYVDQVNKGFPGNNTETGEVGAGGTASLNKTSPVAGKNDMGGKVVGGSPDETNPDGKQIEQPNNQYSKGKGNLPHAGQFKNVPGSDSGKSSFKTKESAKTGEAAGTDKHSPVAK